MASDAFLPAILSALGEDAALASRVSDQREAVPLTSPLAIGALAHDAVATATLMALALGESKSSDAVLSPRRIAACYRSDQLFRLRGEPPAAWASLSGFFETADGWVRTHSNYPHHAEALCRMLNLDGDATPGDIARAVATWNSVDLETRAAETGAIVGAYRNAESWADEQQARAVAATALIEVKIDTMAGDARPATAELPAPLRGIRVIDLTRVIAGPVATRTLALLGADVLRIDNPRRPEISWQHLDTGQGKRSALLDFDRATSSDLGTFHELLARADVLITGYRPGALSRFGLDDDELSVRHPGLIRGYVSAWGTTGPWAHRRGFDSIVQAVSGIAAISSPDGIRPGALPAQALDHTAGYLLAAGVLSALRRRVASRAGTSVTVSLARIAQELIGAGVVAHTGGSESAVSLNDQTVPAQTRSGDMVCAASVFTHPELPDRYPTVGRAWGTDAARWER